MDGSVKSKEVRAGGGVVFDDSSGIVRVLLILRKGVWDLPKGHIESGESIEDGACREVEEETGCRQCKMVHSLGETIHYYTEKGKTIKKRTWWFAMHADFRSLAPQYEEDIKEITWFSVDEALERVGYSNLKEVLMRFSKVNKGNQSHRF